MTKENAIKLFQDQRVRVHWNNDNEKWCFSIVDVIGLLTNSVNPNAYWRKLKENLFKKGYSKTWINQRLKSIEVRKELTDGWELRGVKKGSEYAILTDEITKAWAGFTTKEYKKFKNLKKENLRDNMTNLELVLNMLAEATTKEISGERKPKTFIENKIIANQGGTIAGNARKEIEEKSGKKVISSLNAKALEITEKKETKNLDE
jgi:hypothetical protein